MEDNILPLSENDKNNCSMDTFYFGRLNYNSKRKYNLEDLLNYGNKFRSKKGLYKYGIFSLKRITDPDLGVIFTGELVKYQDLKEEQVVKDDKITIEYIEDVILGKSRFFILENTHLIAYNPYGHIINPKSFCEVFVGILMGADDAFNIDAEIYPINYEYEFMSFMKSMKRLDKLELNLMPSNPNNRPLWKNFDDRLNNMNVRRYKETLEARPNESINVDETVESKIGMAQDGYGKVKGKGIDADNNDVEISTDSKESVTKKDVKNNLEVNEQLISIRSVFISVIDRFKK